MDYNFPSIRAVGTPKQVMNEIEYLVEMEQYDCKICLDTGLIEETGDGDNFEVDVIGHRKCECHD